MKEELRQIGAENNPAKIGIIISTIIIIGGLLPNIEVGIIKIFFPDTLLIFLVGFTSLFFFMHIKVNQNEHAEGGFVVTTTPVHKSPLSKTCLGISIFLFTLTILRIVTLVIFEFIK